MRLNEKKVDSIIALARAKAVAGRKRRGLLFILALATAMLALALMAWLNWPEPDPVPMTVIAADQVTVAGADVAVRAWVRPIRENDEDAALEGQELFFLDAAAHGPGAADGDDRLRERATSDTEGAASIRCKPAQSFSVVVRLPGKSYDFAQVVVWPAHSKVLVVEARHGLMVADEEKFQRKPPSQLPALAGAGRALSMARAKGYQIAYLAAVPHRPEDYRKVRGWLLRNSAGKAERFPQGPVLARRSYAGEEASTSAIEIVQALKRRFKGAIVGIAGRGPDAELFQKAGLKTFLVGPTAEAPANVKKIKTWNELILP